jgi:peptide/nickel transport system substrate-binding protein
MPISFVWLLLIALIVPILAACGAPSGGATTAGTSAPAAGATAAGPAAATTAPQAAATTAGGATASGAATTAPAAAGGGTSSGTKGGTLKILFWQAPTILNPHQSQGTKDYEAGGPMMEPLGRWDVNGKPVPYLAAEIPTAENGGVSKDFKTITWKLKQGIKWSDGTPFTADDVVFTWQYCSDKAAACSTQSNFEPIQKVEALDPHTIKITWKEPNPNPYIAFMGYSGEILQKKQFSACMGAKAPQCAENNRPIGTGPYKLKEFKPGDVVTFERNPNYRDAGKVAFDSVEIKGGGDAVSAARAVCQTGEYDYAWNLQVEKAVADEIFKGGKCDPIVAGSTGIERIVINFANPDPALGDKRSEPDQPHPFLTDLKVRQALSLAIDRKTMAEQIYGIGGKATCNALTQPPELNSPNTKCPFDLEKAKSLLDQAGWKVGADGTTREKNGKKLVISYSTTINSLRQKEQALVKEDWTKLGAVVQLKAVDSGVFFDTDKSNPDTFGHFYNDVQMYTNSNDSPDPTSYFDGFTCAQVASKANGWQLNNNGRYCNKAYDTPEGKSKALQGPTGTTFDLNLWNIADWHK